LSSPENPRIEPSSDIGATPTPQSYEESAGSVLPQSFPIAPLLPPLRDPIWSGWDVLLIAGLGLVMLMVAELATMGVAMALVYPKVPFRELVQRPFLALVGEIIGYIFVAALMILLVEGKYHAPFWKAIRWNWRSHTVPKFLGLGVLTVALDLVGRYLPMPKTTPFEQFFSKPTDAYLIAIFAVSFGPLMEELFFRGFLYPVLARRTGVFAAVVLTAIPFGLMHYLQYQSWGAVLVITMVGVVLTSVRVLTNSVAASFLVHVGYNGTLMGLTAIATDGFRHMDKISVAVLR
jgi:CAAX protease family protein